MKSRLWLILAFGTGLILVGLGAYHRTPKTTKGYTPTAAIKPVAVRCIDLEERQYELTESFYGLIEANARVDMAFQITGRIEQIGWRKNTPLTENQIVREGNVIAKLEPIRYEAAVEQAQATAADAKAAMSTASAEIAQANAQLQDAKRELERLEQLRSRDATTSREVEKAQLQVDLSRAKLEAARASLSSAQAAYRSARAATTMANVDLQDATLRAPMKATVAAVPVEIGQMVQPGDTVATLVDLSKVKLAIGVVERKVPFLREGQTVSVEVLALASQATLLSNSQRLKRPREGVVTVVPPAADDMTGLFNVEIEMDNEDGMLYPGMVGKATVSVMKQRAIAIPATAAVRDGDRAWAFFVKQGYQTGLDLGPAGNAKVDVPATVARRVWFAPMAFDKDYYLVRKPPDGLTQLIVEGHARLRDGQTIRPIKSMAGAPDTQRP